MPRPPNSFNPFHPLLGIMGFLFVITAVGYTIIILREERNLFPSQPAANAGNNQALTAETPLPPREHPLLGLMRQHGMNIILGEVAAIAFLTIGAIGLDRFRDIRAVRLAESLVKSPSIEESKRDVG